MHFPVRVDVSDSRRLRAALFFVHVAAAGSLLGAGLPWWLVVAGGAVLIASAMRWLLRRPVTGCLILEGDGHASWQPEHSAVEPLASLSGTILLPWLVVLHLRREAGQRHMTLLLAGDNCDAEAQRRLRVWLEWVSAPSRKEASGAGR